jgi:hypothetical protein
VKFFGGVYFTQRRKVQEEGAKGCRSAGATMPGVGRLVNKMRGLRRSTTSLTLLFFINPLRLCSLCDFA